MTVVGDAASTLLGCLDAALNEAPNVPAQVCLRVGEVPFSLGTGEDLCCDGLAWVRIVRVYPSTVFPNATQDPSQCAVSRAVEMEMGVVRCLPDHGEVSGASCDEWTATFDQVDADYGAMQAAVCCFRDLLGVGNFLTDQLVEGEWNPIDGQGGCIGGTTRITAQIECDPCA